MVRASRPLAGRQTAHAQRNVVELALEPPDVLQRGPARLWAQVHDEGARWVQVGLLDLEDVFRALPAQSHLEVGDPDTQTPQLVLAERPILHEPGLAPFHGP